MRVLIGCGGTGGHIYPAISIAQALKEVVPEVEVLFVGKKGGMEIDILTKMNHPILEIDIKGFKRGKIIPNLTLPFLSLKSFWQAKKIIDKFQPHIAIGTGGYVCFPTLLAAYSQSIPTLIQEQNSCAGLANKLLARVVDKVCIGYEEVAFSCVQKKLVVTGNPVHPSIYLPKIEQIDALKYFNLMPDKKCLLVIGGSGGADKLNETILKSIPRLQSLGVQLLWITGKKYFAKINQYVMEHHLSSDISCHPFVDCMGLVYAAADVVVSRAGALSIAELCVAQKATILVPSPNVVNDHQTKNSLPLVARGAAILVREQDCEQLLPQVTVLLQDAQKRAMLIEQMQDFRWLHMYALDKIVKEVWLCCMNRLKNGFECLFL